MSLSTTTRRLSFLGTATAAAIGVAALTVPLAPAKAQYFGFEVGPFGLGVAAPAPAYYYPPAYPYHYYGPTYYPSYYSGGYYNPGYYYYPRW
jgi:hypothetical protein